MVIEFLGLPGSGKSYIANAYQNIKKNNYIKTVNITSLLRTNILLKVQKKIYYIFPDINLKVRKIYREIRREVSNKTYVSQYGLYSSLDEAIKMIAINTYYLNKCLNKNTIYLFDEGPLHAIVKVAADYNFSFDVVKHIYMIIHECQEERMVVYNKCTVEMCMRFIKQRNRHVCRFDELKDSQLYSILQQYKKYSEYLAQLSGAITINRTESLEKNIKKIDIKQKELIEE